MFNLVQLSVYMEAFEAELYAIIYSSMNESLLLAFSKIIIHTDCKSLTYLFRFSKICTKLSRWQIILSSFNTEIIFEPSTSVGIQLSDLLSRRPGDKPINRRPKIEEIEESEVIAETEDTMTGLEIEKYSCSIMATAGQALEGAAGRL